MIKQSYLNFYFILFITHNLVSAAEIEYYWSGATTEKSAVVSFATDSDAKIRVQYSDNKNFRTNTLYSRTQVVGSRSNHFSKIKLSSLKPEKTYYYRFSVNGIIDKTKTGKFRTHSKGPFSYNCLLYTSPSPRDQRGSRMPASA